MLEIITEKAKGQHKGSIVFVHGAWHGLVVESYNATQLMYPDAPHNLFATEGWQKVAFDIQNFLEK
jgi:hypothetical protein